MSDNLTYFQRLRLIKQDLLPKEAVAKKKKPIRKISEKKKKEMADEKKSLAGDETPLVKWFKQQIRFMPEHCEETGLKMETKIFKYAIMSICHILPKSTCKSVALHPLNRMFFNVDFHHKFDAMSWEEKEKLGCWPIIQERLIIIYPDLHPSEHRHFPESVVKFIENNEPFKILKMKTPIKSLQEILSPEKEKSGFFDLDIKKQCNHPSHEPPSHIHIPQGKGYKHICPNCGRVQVIIPQQISY